MNKRLEKIYLKIDSLAKKGNLGIIEYKQYINNLIDSGEFFNFRDVLERKYGIYTQESTVDDIKRTTFDIIRLKTYSSSQEEIKKIFDKFSVYQLGIYVYDSEPVVIGRIFLDGSSLNVFNDDGENIFLNDPTTTLIQKYCQAITFLLETLSYVDDEYIDDYVVVETNYEGDEYVDDDYTI